MHPLHQTEQTQSYYAAWMDKQLSEISKTLQTHIILFITESSAQAKQG